MWKLAKKPISYVASFVKTNKIRVLIIAVLLAITLMSVIIHVSSKKRFIEWKYDNSFVMYVCVINGKVAMVVPAYAETGTEVVNRFNGISGLLKPANWEYRTEGFYELAYAESVRYEFEPKNVFEWSGFIFRDPDYRNPSKWNKIRSFPLWLIDVVCIVAVCTLLRVKENGKSKE